ncbi:MAG: hypothetical protein HY236_06160 [Acidobacteria bacterium]|nr:hypothetical protein [Acidobacteriota bacterium]
MPAFTDQIDARHRIKEVVALYPATREVFEAYGVGRGGWNCAIRIAAWRSGIELSGLLEELNRAAVAQPWDAGS